MRNYCFLFLLMCSAILPLSVYATSAEPTGYRSTVEPQSYSEFPFTITNTNDTNRTYDIRIADRASLESPSNIAAWFTVPDSITLAPSESQTITVQTTIPAAALPGDRYTYLVLSERSPAGVVTVSPEIALPVTITVAGEIQETVVVNLLNLTTAGTDVQSLIVLINTGMVEVPVNGRLNIATKQGVLTDITISDTIRAGETLSKSVRDSLPQWYIGYIDTSFVGVYGVFDEQLSMSERMWYISPLVRYTSGLIGIVLAIGLIIHIKKKSSYVREDTK